MPVFTRTLLEKAERPAGVITLVLTDDRTPGLHFHIGARTKTFFVVYYFGRKPFRHKVGRWPATSLEFARAEAARIAHDVQLGHNPIRARDKSLEDAFEASVKDGLLFGSIKQATVDHQRALLKRHCADWLKRDISTLKKADFVELQTRLAEAGKKGTANLLQSIITKVLHFRELPVPKLKKFKLKPRDNLSDDWAGFYCDLQKISPNKRNCWLFMAFTGIRVGTAKTLTWNQVDFKKATVFLPSVKSGLENVVLPLSKDAVAVLKAQRSLDDVFVFPGDSKAGHLVDPRDARVNARPQDTRRLFTTCADQAGLRDRTIGKLRSDKVQTVLGGYDKNPPSHADTELVAAKVREALGLQ